MNKKVYDKIYRQNNWSRISKYLTNWRRSNPQLCKQYNQKQYDKQKELVFNHYGNYCRCCGENTFEFLTIDHINRDGNIQRKYKRLTGKRFYGWIIKNNYPANLQILCFNCNCGRERTISKECPHKLKILAAVAI